MITKNLHGAVISKHIHDVIYVPGIGDTKTTFQELAAQTWRLYGVVPHTFAMRWADQEPFEPKFHRLLALIDAKLERGHKVSLVGASAGATVVLNAFAARPNITGVVCISGKVNRPEAIGGWYRKHAPAFVESANSGHEKLQHFTDEHRSRILSLYGVIDMVVPKKDSHIPGGTNRVMPSLGHAGSIAFGLVIAPIYWVRFLKSLR